MFACIPLLLMALFLYGIHRIGNAQIKEFREMKLTKGEGVIDHYASDNGYTKYYIRFNVNGKTMVKKAVGSHCGKKGYEIGVRIPIAYHVDEKGCVTVFIDDDSLESKKNRENSNMFLYAALVVVGIAIICVIKALLKG